MRAAGSLLSLLALTVRDAGAGCTEGRDVCVDERTTGSGVDLSMRNGELYDVFVVVDLELENMASAPESPVRKLVPARSSATLSRIRVQDRALPWRWRYSWRWVTGDPDAVHDDAARYVLPFHAGTPRCVLQGFGGSFSHTGTLSSSIDFEMPVGTRVLAARGGMVVEVVDGFTEGGPDRALWRKANKVVIRHDDGTLASYLHLRPGGALVRPGARVRAGQPIAESGNTGFTSAPHLHFMVHVGNPDDLENYVTTVPIRFDDGSAEGFVPDEGRWCGHRDPAAGVGRARIGR